MLKKYTHHFKRGTIIGLESVCIVAVIALIAWVGLIVRLMQGPMNVDTFTSAIARGMHAQNPAFNFTLGDTLLTWGGASQPFVFEIKNVQVSRADGTPVLLVEKVGVQFSKSNLVIGRFIPRVIHVYSPSVRITRTESGFDLNINASQQSGEDAAIATQPADDLISRENLTRSLFDKLLGAEGSGVFSGLDQITVQNAAVLYEDKVLNVSLRSRKAAMAFTRESEEILAEMEAEVDAEGATTPARIRTRFVYDMEMKNHVLAAAFAGLNPAWHLKDSVALKNFSSVNLPLKGSIAVEMDSNFMPMRTRFSVGADAGTFSAFGLYPVEHPLPVKSFYTKGHFNFTEGTGALEEMHADLDGPTVSAQVEAIKGENDDRVVRVTGLLKNTLMDKLKFYWPDKLAPDPRSWVTQNLSAGTATRATVDLSLIAQQGDWNSLRLGEVGGKIDFKGIKVDYFSPLMPVTGVNGQATYDHESFNIETTDGMLGDMRVGKGKIAITDLDVQDHDTNSHIEIDVTLSGPLRTALKVLASKPLEYPQEFGIAIDQAQGNAAVDVSFKFPLHKSLAVEQVDVTAKAKLTDVRLDGIIPDFTLSGGPLDLTLKDGVMSVSGAGFLDAVPLQLNAKRDFGAKAETSTEVDAKLTLTPAALAKFGVPADLMTSGSLPMQAVYKVMADGSGTLRLDADAAGAGLSVPIANYEKKEGVPAKVSLTLGLTPNRQLTYIHDLNYQAEGASLQGDVNFTADSKKLQKAILKEARLGATDVNMTIDAGSGGGYSVKIMGKQFDASSFLEKEKKTPGQVTPSMLPPPQPVPPLAVSMTVSRLIMGKEEGRALDNVKLLFTRDGWSRLDRMELNAVAGQKPLTARYLPVAGAHTLRFEAQNAGAALATLGITKGMRGGKLTVVGNQHPNKSPRDMQGTMSVQDFTLAEVPALGRLLNAMSLGGIVELLNGKGISFRKARANFEWIDQGLPGAAGSVRRIRVKGGETAGASLGLTFEGNIDMAADTLAIDGTIIPVSDINKLVSSIPVVGQILTGGGNAVFAATYTVKGPMDQPTVSVNPLSVLAPGIIRKLFFEQ